MPTWPKDRKQLESTITTAIDGQLPIPPILSMITMYAECIGCVETALMIDGNQPDFGELTGIVRSADRRYLVVADRFGRLVHRLALTYTERIGSQVAYGRGDWMEPTAICRNPIRTDSYFVADRSTIWQTDDAGTIRIAGRLPSGINRTTYVSSATAAAAIQRLIFADGIGSAAAFGHISGCVSTSNGRLLYVTDLTNNAIRSINVATTQVTTIAVGGGSNLLPSGCVGKPIPFYSRAPNKLTFYRHPTAKPDSVLLITTYYGILRYDIDAAVLSTVLTVIGMESRSDASPLNPNGICCTSTGTIIFGCISTFSLYAIDPTTDKIDRIAGRGFVGASGISDGPLDAASFRIITDLSVDDDAGCLWLIENALPNADLTSAIRRVSMPPHLFWSDS